MITRGFYQIDVILHFCVIFLVENNETELKIGIDMCYTIAAIDWIMVRKRIYKRLCVGSIL